MANFFPHSWRFVSPGRAAWVVALLLVVSALVAPAQAAVAATPPRVFHIAPVTAGRGDGSNWANAGNLSKLPAFVQAAGPGDEVWLLGGRGPYSVTKPLSLKYGGEPGAPVTVRGVAADGSGALAPVLVGTRTSPWTASGKPGSHVFRLLAGANHLRFVNLDFANQGNGCFYLGGPVRDITIEGVRATNVRRLVENYTVTGQETATVTGLVLRDIEVRGYSRGVVRLQYDTNNVLLEDVYGDSERQQDGDIAMGVHLDGTVHDVMHRRVTMLNSHYSAAAYWNGDGFASERSTYRLTYEDTYSAGHTDGGYDLKSRDTTLVRAVAEDNKRNFRFWGTNVELRDSRGSTPFRRGGSGSQDQLNTLWGSTVNVRNSTFTDASNSTLVFDVDDQSVVTVDGGLVRRSQGSTLSQVDTAGARLELNGVQQEFAQG
jgi:hypothetical protein